MRGQLAVLEVLALLMLSILFFSIVTSQLASLRIETSMRIRENLTKAKIFKAVLEFSGDPKVFENLGEKVAVFLDNTLIFGEEGDKAWIKEGFLTEYGRIRVIVYET